MQKRLSLIPFLCLSIGLLAQTSFQRHFGDGSNFDEAVVVVPDGDGEYLVAGATANFGAEGYDMLLEKVDDAGNTLWQVTWGGAGNDQVRGVVRASTGGYLVWGHTGDEPGNSDLVALRLDEDGEVLWQVVRGGPYQDEAIRAFEMADGGFFIAGHVVVNEGLAQDIYLIRTDDQGTVTWEQNLAFPGIDILRDAAPAMDGGVFLLREPDRLTKLNAQGGIEWEDFLTGPNQSSIFVSRIQRTADGKLRTSGLNFSTVSPFLAELNEGGEFLSFFEFSGSLGFSTAQLFSLTSDGKIWVMTRNLYGNVNANDPFLQLFDPVTETVLLSKSIGDLNIDDLARSPFVPIGLSATAEGGFMLAVNTFSNAGGSNGLVVRADENGEESWRKVIGVEGVYDFESARMVIETLDGGFLLAGNDYTTANDRDMWLIRTNAAGQEQWSTHLGGQGADGVTVLDQLSDGSFVVTGFRNDTLLISRINDNGTPLWYREYSLDLADGTFGMTVTPLDEILITMPVARAPDFNIEGMLVKVNTQGDTLWTQTYLNADSFSPTYGVTPAAVGGYYLCGCVENEDGVIVPLLIKTDADGHQVWANTYGEFGSFACLITLRQASSGDLFANGVSLGGGTRPLVLRTSWEGVEVWADTLAVAGGNTYFSWFSDLQKDTEYQTLFGRKTIANPIQPISFSAGAITLLSPDGTIIWEKDFGQDIRGSFSGGIATADGGFAAVGSAVFDNSTDAWLVKTEPDGTVAITARLDFPFQVKIAPNPADDWLRLSLAGLSPGSLQLSIVNLNGQILYTESLGIAGERLERTLEVGAFAPGVYFLQLQQGGKSRTVKWVKR